MLAPLPVPDWDASLAEMTEGFAARLNVYGIMAHHPDLLRAWSAFRNHVVLHTSLGPQFSEVVILRSGVRLGSDYEWNHHVSRGRAVGLSDARILSIRGAVEGMQADDAVLCRAVDGLFDHHRLGAGDQAALVALVGRQGMLDLMATVAHYSLLGFFLNSFDVPLDRRIVEELAETPLASAAG